MKQPEDYNNEDELIEWLKCDLEQQRNKGIPEKELILNIGNAENIEFIKNYERNKLIKTEINFDFNFKQILEGVLRLENKELEFDDKNNRIICPYKLNVIKVTFSGEAYFSLSTFSGVAYFSDSTFSGDADFRGSTFSGEAHFSFSTFSVKANFSSSTFSGDADFSASTFSVDADFSFSTFSGKANFSLSTFSGEANFSYSKFSGEANFSFSTFSGEANFSRSTFSGEANFSYFTFSGEVNFWRSTFSGKVNFDNIHFKENKEKDRISIKFDNIKLEDNSYISFNNINYDDETKEFTESKNSKIEIINTLIKGRVDFNNVGINEINFEGSNIMNDGVINRINFEASPLNSDTACILKNEELKKNNTIKALKFKAIEKDLYLKELIAKKEKTLQTRAEILSIKLSKLSNNHGQDWFRAVLFTLGFGFLFFSLAYLFISDVNIYNIKCLFTSFFMKDYFNYLIPTNFELIKNVHQNTNILFYIFYILGKIAISYGIVEIVQAFRKLNSKA